MAKKVLNTRCPLQTECERKCAFEGRELDCDYYWNNAVGEDRTIPDQEEIREQRNRAADEAELEKALANCEDDEEDTPEAEQIAGAGKLVYIPIGNLYPHPDNPRKDLGDLSELAESIKANGVLQNLTVVPRLGEITKKHFGNYTVIIGHRRLGAAKLAGLTELPCVVASMTPKEQLSTMLTENMQRSDLTIYEQAQGFQMMLDMGDSLEEIAQKSGFSKTTVRRRLEIAKLDAKTMQKVSGRQLTLGDFDELAKVEDMEARNKVLKSMGTANFQNELKTVLEKQEFKKKSAEWLEVVKTFATEEPGATYSTHQYVRCYNKWSRGDVEIPEDADTVKYVYTVKDGDISIYKEKDMQKEEQEKAEREAKNRKAEELRAEFEDINRRHFELRCDFVKALSNATVKKALGRVATYCTDIMWAVSSGGYNSPEVDPELIGHILGVNITEEELEQAGRISNVSAIKAEMEIHPEKAVLALAYSAADHPANGYWRRLWNGGEYGYEHKENEELDTLYELLSEFGYELSDEEEQAKNGTHPLFPKEGQHE